ncbi:MAG TPA: PPK2 family polyphosphate kinase [Phycisphaerae bacterium]|nr:PPK2 family polyphosphate kinase [Phycisphaerae bacterium]
MKLKDFDHLRVNPGDKIRLHKWSTDSTKHVPDREEADQRTRAAAVRLGEFQDRLYAGARESLLVILQGMDASGKDGAVRKVFDAVNPAGIQVTSFKQPSSEELRHDFLWRCHAKVPPRGYIGVFNRSYYEDVLVVRVHAPRLLAPELQKDKHIWKQRFAMIRSFEQILADSSTRIVKFFLHISKDEQRRRFEARQKEPDKHWKLAAGDFEERTFWQDYQDAYEDMLGQTSTDHAPWHIIPADHKWVRDYWMVHILDATMKSMDIPLPTLADPSLVKRKFD